jgi:hypothetical protein
MGLHRGSSLTHYGFPKRKYGRRDSSVSIVTRLRAGRTRNRGLISGGVRDDSLLQNSPTTTVEPIQPPIKWVAKEVGEESVELNLHTPTRLHCMYGIFISFYCTQSRGGIAQTVQRLGYGLDGPGFRNPEEARHFFSSPKRPDWLWGPPRFMFSGSRSSFTGVMWPECEVNHSPPSGAFVARKGTNFPYPFTKSKYGSWGSSVGTVTRLYFRAIVVRVEVYLHSFFALWLLYHRGRVSRYPLSRRLGGSRSQSGYFVEEKIYCLCKESSHGSLVKLIA